MAPIHRIDECLSTIRGHLFVEECDCVELVSRFGSPLFVMSEDQLRRNVRRFRDAFQQGWPDGPVKVLPAAKANWISALHRILADEGCGCDIYSPGELTVALEAGMEPELISVNGVPKDESHIYRSVQAGVRITIDSVDEVDWIEKAADELDLVARVRIRLKPPLYGFVEHSDFVAEGLVPTDMAVMVYKGGLAFDDVMAVAPRILRSNNVELMGFHQHYGRHNSSLRYWRELMRAFARETGKICRALGGFQPQEIDIGGGYPVPRDPFNARTDYSEPFQLAAFHALSRGMHLFASQGRYRVMSRIADSIVKKPRQKLAPSIEDYARICTGTLMKELPKNGINTRGLMLQIEPGRGLFGNAGIHLTKVTNIKRLKDPIRWNVVIVDSTEFFFAGGRLEHNLHHYLFANKTDAAMVDKADIAGRSCFEDRIMPCVPIPDVEVGDTLAVLDTGAYQEVSMGNFNAIPRPPTVLVTRDRAAIIRRGETEEDVLSRDVIPDHLKPRSE